MNKFPIQIFVYKCDEDDHGQPIYSVAITVDEIPEEYRGAKIATNKMSSEGTLSIGKSIN